MTDCMLCMAGREVQPPLPSAQLCFRPRVACGFGCSCSVWCMVYGVWCVCVCVCVYVCVCVCVFVCSCVRVCCLDMGHLI